MKDKILVVCPTIRDKRELYLTGLDKKFDISFQSYDDTTLERIVCNNIGWLSEDFNPKKTIDFLVQFCNKESINGIIGTEDYPGCIFASIVAKHVNKLGPRPTAVLRCQHKYYSRIDQQVFVPEATPVFQLINPITFADEILRLPFPLFIKPVKAFFSFYANKVNCLQELQKCITESIMPEAFLSQFNWFLKQYSPYKLDGHYLIAEELLQGDQVTVVGSVFNKEITIHGIVDSIMYENTICFKRFEYPSSLPETVQKRMGIIAQKIMKKINFDNGMFNIELMHNPNTNDIHIIEINPRMPSQFADLFEKVNGINLYEILCNGVLGITQQKKSAGIHSIAASFVLRIFEDKKVVKIPSQKEIEKVLSLMPDARIQITASEGNMLSEEFQDGKSYRYCLIHLGARDKQELLEKYEFCLKHLPFKFG